MKKTIRLAILASADEAFACVLQKGEEPVEVLDDYAGWDFVESVPRYIVTATVDVDIPDIPTVEGKVTSMEAVVEED